MADIVIIGGGFAGLAAGTRLAERGARVTVLERRGFLGGRAYSFVDPTTGDVVDNGQHLFLGCYHHTIQFLKRIGTIDKLKIQDAPQVQFLNGGSKPAVFHCPLAPPPWHLLLGLWRLQTLGLWDKYRALAVGMALRRNSQRSTGAMSKMSVSEWLDHLRQPPRAQRNFWNPVATAALNQDPSRASAGLFVRVLREAFLADPRSAAIGISTVGLSDLYTHAAEDFIRRHSGCVRLRASAFHVVTMGGKAVGVELKGNEVIDADVVIAAVPPMALSHMLPANIIESESRLENLSRLRASPIISINLWFDRVITDLAFAGLLGSRVHWLFNKDKIFSVDRRDRTQLAFVISAASDYSSATREELIKLAVEECERLLPGSRRATLLHAVVVKEREATISHEVGTEQFRLGPETPIRNFFIAGDWTDTGLPATIESAVTSGHRAADLAIGT